MTARAIAANVLLFEGTAIAPDKSIGSTRWLNAK